MGAVFRARHVLMDTPVALKWLRPDVIDSCDARERLLREARAVARIRHPNVVHVYDVDTHDGAPFVVMELLEGESFAELIARESVPISRVLELLIGAMKGLSAAHEHGIVHRDIKPENIFIARERRHPDGVPKLLDFGISIVTGAEDGRITPQGHSVGTPIFMSVEQLTGTDEVDQRSDVYSFGVVLYRALTGKLPFDGDTFASVVIDIATKEPSSPKQLRPDLPSSLDRVVMKAMARDRADRYPTVDALIEALHAAEETFGHTPPSVYASVLTPKPPPMHTEGDDGMDAFYATGTPRRLRAYVLAAAAGVGLGVLGWALFSPSDQQPGSAQRAVPEPPVGAAAPASSPEPAATREAADPAAVPRLEEPKAPARAPAAAGISGQGPNRRAPAKRAPARRANESVKKATATQSQPRAPAKQVAKEAAPSGRATPSPEPEQRQSAPAPAGSSSAGRSGGLTRDDF